MYMTTRAKKLLLVTGETSGDHHGARVISALNQMAPGLRAYGIGGDELAKAGMELLYHSRDLSVVGISEVLLRANHIVKAYRLLKRELIQSPPDLLMLIDYPEFNLRIARIAHKHGVPVFYYISPQIWAWRKGRAKKIARIIDKMAVIFPFEVPFYRQVGLDAEFVGHPLVDRDIQLPDKQQALQSLGLGTAGPVIGILPGSRKSEISGLLPPMLEAAGRIRQEFGDARFVLPLAPGIEQEYLQAIITRQKVPVNVVSDNFRQAVAVCDFVLVASGTATLETAIMEKPMIIVYKVSPLSYAVGKLLIEVPFIGLVNIVAGKKVVPELIQQEVTPERIARESISLLKDRARMAAIAKELGSIKHALGSSGAAQRVARIAYTMITGNR